MLNVSPARLLQHAQTNTHRYTQTHTHQILPFHLPPPHTLCMSSVVVVNHRTISSSTQPCWSKTQQTKKKMLIPFLPFPLGSHPSALVNQVWHFEQNTQILHRALLFAWQWSSEGFVHPKMKLPPALCRWGGGRRGSVHKTLFGVSGVKQRYCEVTVGPLKHKMSPCCSCGVIQVSPSPNIQILLETASYTPFF